MDKELYSVKEFCEKYGISRSKFYTLLKEGKTPQIVKIGTRTLIVASSVPDWLNGFTLSQSQPNA